MVLIIKIDNTIRTILLYLTMKQVDTIVVQIRSGRTNVSHVSPHVSVRNLTQTGLNINRINSPKVNQYKYFLTKFFVID